MPAPSKAWVDIADSQVDADSPLDTTLVTGLRDNQIHLEEAMGKDYVLAVNHDHDNVNSKAVVLDVSVGDYLSHDNATERIVSVLGSATAKIKESILRGKGTLRISFSAHIDASGGTSTAQICRNGVTVGTLRTVNTSTYQTWSEDIAGWSDGDLVQIYFTNNSGGSRDVTVKDFQLYGDVAFSAASLKDY